MSRFLKIDDGELSFSERKAERAGFELPWSLEELVRARQMECAGASEDEIAQALSRTIGEVREKLAPAEALGEPRQERASVGFEHFKGRR